MLLRRLAAGVIDVILMSTMALSPLFLAAAFLPGYMDAPAGQPPTLLMGATLLWMIVVLLWYFPGFESSRLMATPGKFLMRLKAGVHTSALPHGLRAAGAVVPAALSGPHVGWRKSH